MASTCSAADDDPTTPAAGSSDQSGRPWPPVSESDVVQLLNTIPKASAWLVKWRLLADYIRPYEPDWRAYHDRTKYGGDSVTMEVHPAVAKHGSQIKMVEGLLKLGFVRSERLPQNQFQMQRRRTQERTERLKQEKRSRLLTRSDNKKQHVTWQIPHEPSLLSNETNESASLLSVSVSGDQTSFCGTSTSGGDDVSESAAGDGGRQAQLSSESQLLKDQVCELTRQVRMLRAASLAHTSVKPVAPFIVKAQYWAPTSGNHPVRLQINYLDPDKAPYRVALQLQSAAGPSLYSPPCTIIDHQYVVFIAPPQPPGSCPLTLYGTTETSQLKKYCPSTWLEYKKTDDDAATATDSLRGGSAAGSTAARLTSAMKGSRRIRSDRKSSIASGASSQLRPRDSSSSANAAAPAPATSSSSSAAAAAAAATFGGGGSAAPAEAAVAVAAAAAAAAAARQEVTLSLPPRREGLTHHQINEHNALNILPTCRVDPSEGPDTFDPTSDLKSHSEMKSEFTSDMADEEERADDDDDVWQARQFRALLPPGLDCPDPDHPPLTKETLELLTLGHGWSREGLEKSLSGSKTVNFLLSRSSAAAAAGLGSLSGLAGGGGGGGGGLASVSGGGSASGGFGGSVVVAGGVPAAPRSAGGNTPSLRSTSPVYCGGSVGGGAGGGGGGGGSGGGGGVGAALSSSPSGGGGGKLSQSLAHWAPLSRPLSKTSLSEEGSTASGGGPPGSTGAPPRGGLAGAATSSAFSETGSAVALMTTLPSTPPESVQPSESVDRASSSFRSSPPATATPSPARQSRTRSRKHPASVAAAAAAAGTAAAAPPSASSTASSVSVSSSAGSALLPPAPAPPPAVATPPPSAAPLHGNAHGGSRHKPPHQPPHASSGAGQQSSSSGGKGGTHAPRR